MSNTIIPVHDPSGHGGRPHEPAHDHPGPWDQLEQSHTPAAKVAHPPFALPNGQAAPVNQRAAADWFASTEAIAGTDSAKLVDRQAGRAWVLISVPAGSPAGVVVDNSADSLLVGGAPNGFHIAVGGSVSLPTEGPVWAVSATPGTATTCDVAVGVN